MTLAEAMQRANALPPEKQHVISEFIEFLLTRSEANPAPEKHVEFTLDTPFVGMWADRPEMADSVEYVKALRKREWEGRHAVD